MDSDRKAGHPKDMGKGITISTKIGILQKWALNLHI